MAENPSEHLRTEAVKDEINLLGSRLNGVVDVLSSTDLADKWGKNFQEYCQQSDKINVEIPRNKMIVSEFRKGARNFLDRYGVSEPLKNDFELIVSELVTNEIKYGELGIVSSFQLQKQGDDIILNIEGKGKEKPSEQEVGEGGRGLFITETITKEYDGTIVMDLATDPHKIAVEIPLKKAA